MNIHKNYDIKTETTFGVTATTWFFCECHSLEDLKEAIVFAEAQDIAFLILGGGSNVLFTHDFDGLIIKLSLKGIKIEDESKTNVIVNSQAGEQWHDLVLYTLDNNFGGIENLSLIPGSVGAAPMQNIGAYGVEIQQVFHELKALDVATGEVVTMNKKTAVLDTGTVHLKVR